MWLFSSSCPLAFAHVSPNYCWPMISYSNARLTSYVLPCSYFQYSSLVSEIVGCFFIFSSSWFWRKWYQRYDYLSLHLDNIFFLRRLYIMVTNNLWVVMENLSWACSCFANFCVLLNNRLRRAVAKCFKYNSFSKSCCFHFICFFVLKRHLGSC